MQYERRYARIYTYIDKNVLAVHQRHQTIIYLERKVMSVMLGGNGDQSSNVGLHQT